MNELELSRKEISRIDAEMAKLFEERMHQQAFKLSSGGSPVGESLFFLP